MPSLNPQWDCDVSQGDIQCPYVLPTDTGYHNCQYKTGHDCPHETAHGKARKQAYWYIPPINLSRDAYTKLIDSVSRGYILSENEEDVRTLINEAELDGILDSHVEHRIALRKKKSKEEESDA